MNEGNCTDTGGGFATGTVFAQAAFHRAQKDAQHSTLQGGVALQKVAQTLGHREHPLAYGQSGKNVIGQMCGSLGHAPCVAGGAYAAPFAREGDEEVVAAFVAVGADEAFGENSAVEIAPEGLLNVSVHRNKPLRGVLCPAVPMGLNIRKRMLACAATSQTPARCHSVQAGHFQTHK